MPPEMVFSADDLLLYDQGPSVMQHERQRRVVACVQELGFIATHSESSGVKCAQCITNSSWDQASVLLLCVY